MSNIPQEIMNIIIHTSPNPNAGLPNITKILQELYFINDYNK